MHSEKKYYYTSKIGTLEINWTIYDIKKILKTPKLQYLVTPWFEQQENSKRLGDSCGKVMGKYEIGEGYSKKVHWPDE